MAFLMATPTSCCEKNWTHHLSAATDVVGGVVLFGLAGVLANLAEECCVTMVGGSRHVVRRFICGILIHDHGDISFQFLCF